MCEKENWLFEQRQVDAVAGSAAVDAAERVVAAIAAHGFGTEISHR